MKGFQFFRGKYVTVFLMVSWIFGNIFAHFSRIKYLIRYMFGGFKHY